jgi:hypothetical protein
MQTPITKRLTRDTSYKKATNTYQDLLSPEDIAKKLEDYSKVKKEDIFKIPINSHVRYFTLGKSGEKEFRLGGVITKFGDNGEYVVLSNGTFSWSVQIKNTTFYKKLNLNEIKEKAVDDVKINIDTIMKENKELKKMLKQIKDTTINAKKK